MTVVQGAVPEIIRATRIGHAYHFRISDARRAAVQPSHLRRFAVALGESDDPAFDREVRKIIPGASAKQWGHVLLIVFPLQNAGRPEFAQFVRWVLSVHLRVLSISNNGPIPNVAADINLAGVIIRIRFVIGTEQ